jgi:hypothetical protein
MEQRAAALEQMGCVARGSLITCPVNTACNNAHRGID